MAWSTVTIGMVSSKPEDCGVSFLSRSSYKVSMYTCVCAREFIYFVENNSIKTSLKRVSRNCCSQSECSSSVVTLDIRSIFLRYKLLKMKDCYFSCIEMYISQQEIIFMISE